MSDSAPPPERLQHGRVTRAERQIADSQGGIGRPFLAETTLARMLRRGDIDTGQWYAGTLFAELFQRAGLDPLKAAGPVRIATGSDLPNGATHARQRIHAALDALGGIGSPCGSCAWFTLGLEMSLDDWRRREGWSGRPLRHETATLVLVGTLSVLAAHFRLTSFESA